MSRKLIRTAVVLSSLWGAFLLAAPAQAASPTEASAFSAVPAAVQAQTTLPPGPTDAPAVPTNTVTPAPTGTATAATPTETTQPAGPANPGTGETQQAEETRLDWAPIVIGAILVLLLIVILIWARRRRDTTIV